jgi:hypothetical protein
LRSAERGLPKSGQRSQGLANTARSSGDQAPSSAFCTVVVPRWGGPWFALSLGVVIGVMMICYIATPSRLIGVKPTVSRTDKLADSAVSTAFGAAVCTPPYIIGRIGVLMLGSRVLFIPGIVVFALGVTLQAGLTGAVKAIKPSARLIAGRQPAAKRHDRADRRTAAPGRISDPATEMSTDRPSRAHMPSEQPNDVGAPADVARGTLPRDLLSVIRRDPLHPPERLTLIAQERLAQPSLEWAEQARMLPSQSSAHRRRQPRPGSATGSPHGSGLCTAP